MTIPSNSAVGASACGSVTIVGDDIVENDEVFQVMVTPDDSDDQIAGTPRFTITITSESGDGTFALYETFTCIQFLKSNGTSIQKRTLYTFRREANTNHV